MTDADKLEAALRTALGLPDGIQLEGIAYGRTQGWDSVAHMQLVAAIENAFGIMMETEEVIAMSNYSTIREILRDHHDIVIDA